MARETLEEPPPAAKAEPALEYTRRFGPGDPVTVRGIRLLVVLTLVNTTLLGMSVLGPQLFPFLSQRWQQWQASRAQDRAKRAAMALQDQCFNHTAPAGKVAYDEDPAESARMRRDDGAGFGPWGGAYRSSPPGWVSPAAAPVPSYLPQYTDAIFDARISGMDNPVLFLHGRTTASGAKYVVCVQLSLSMDFNRRLDPATGGATFQHAKRRTLIAHVWPAGAGGPSAAKGKGRQRSIELLLPDRHPRVIARLDESPDFDTTTAIDYGNLLRMYEGRPDPADPSRFTIPYRLDGRDGVIDGWITDERLHLRPREGKPSFKGSGEAWSLSTGTASQPSPPTGDGGQPQSPP